MEWPAFLLPFGLCSDPNCIADAIQWMAYATAQCTSVINTGKRRDPIVMSQMRCLHSIAAKFNLLLSVTHLSGIQNTTADAIYRINAHILFLVAHRYISPQSPAAQYIPAQPLVWWRCIDDIFAIWTHGEPSLGKFLSNLNSHHMTIKFTASWSIEDTTFLDIRVPTH